MLNIERDFEADLLLESGVAVDDIESPDPVLEILAGQEGLREGDLD